MRRLRTALDRSFVPQISVYVVLWCMPQVVRAQQGTLWIRYGPPTRYQHTAVYDPGSDRMIVFGGQHTTTSLNFNDIWWASNVTKSACLPPCNLQWTWPVAHLSRPPAPRFGHTAIYDSVNNRMTIFGGATGVASPAPCLNDVSVLSDANGVGGTEAWTKLAPSGAPPAKRYGHSAVYDSTNNLMIVFGGNNCSTTYFNDVWVLSNANGLGGTPAWSQLSPNGAPPAPRGFASAVYDAVNNRMIVYGGANGSNLGDAWVLSNANGLGGSPMWTLLKPSRTLPSARFGHTAVYDSANNLMIVYGGNVAKKSPVGDTWVLSNANGLGGAPLWTLTVPDTGTSPERSLHSAVYDPVSNKMIIFAGKPRILVKGNPSDDHVYVLNTANGLRP